MNRQKMLGLLLVTAVALGATGCGSEDEKPSAVSSTTTTAAPTTTEAAGISTDTLFPDGLRGLRYCEVLLLSEDDGSFRADVYNTLGLTDCPQDQWDALDAGAITAERDVTATILNGPRYWTLDEIVQLEERERVESTFGELPMFLAATVELGETLPEQTPYTERHVARQTVFRFDAGTEVHELTAPDGRRYVMQSFSHIFDDSQTLDTLAGLGDHLELPEGWTFASRVLDEQLDVLSADGVATVVQDDLQNTYQRIDEGTNR
ncbi:MAG TPA: hypothetical protein VF228_23715 [Iamia sp.]